MNTMLKHDQQKMIYLIPVFVAYFVMGFVDIVGVSTSYVKNDFNLSDTVANLLPMMVFVWFAVCSLPTGVLMGRIGRKNMVMLSLILTTVSMLIPLVSYSFFVVMLAFIMLGISNTMLQVCKHSVKYVFFPQISVINFTSKKQSYDDTRRSGRDN